MGCKFMHIMPTDRETQLSLGLTHGLPMWYRRTFNVDAWGNPSSAIPNTADVSGSRHSSRLAGPWRQLGGPKSPTPSQGGNGRIMQRM